MDDLDTEKENLNTSLTNIALALTAGYLTRKIIVGNSKSVVQKSAGILAEVIVANLVFNNAEQIKVSTRNFFNKFLKQQE